MGKHDIRISSWLSTREHFADLCNGALCNGEVVFRPENLRKIDAKQTMTLQPENGKTLDILRFRDIAMQTESGTGIFVLTCENQDKTHYAMPVRSMLYDSLEYASQVKSISKNNRREKHLTDSAEFLSGMTSEDRLTPVIPVVFYYGEEPWTASTDLHSLLDISDQDYRRFGKFIPNYQINLVDARELVNKKCLRIDLQLVLGMLEYRKEKMKLQEYLNKHKEYFEHMDLDTYYAARALLGSEKQLREYGEKEREVNMCKALEDLYQDGISIGEERGRKSGESHANTRYSRLILKLSESGQTELIVKVAENPEYREKLLREYGI